jgi:predicted RNase H-like HicB family nuclease
MLSLCVLVWVIASSAFDKACGLGYTQFTMIGQFTAVYLKRGKWYVAYVEEIPGVNTQGRTLAGAKRNLKEALELVLEANRELAHKAHGKHVIEEPISVAVE